MGTSRCYRAWIGGYVSDKYILDDNGEPVICNDTNEWAQWFEEGGIYRRSVSKDDVGESFISTVFLGIDHSFGFGGSPVLWETMVFGGKYDGEERRYTSLADAKMGHKEILLKVMLDGEETSI